MKTSVLGRCNAGTTATVRGNNWVTVFLGRPPDELPVEPVIKRRTPNADWNGASKALPSAKTLVSHNHLRLDFEARRECLFLENG